MFVLQGKECSCIWINCLSAWGGVELETQEGGVVLSCVRPLLLACAGVHGKGQGYPGRVACVIVRTLLNKILQHVGEPLACIGRSFKRPWASQHRMHI